MGVIGVMSHRVIGALGVIEVVGKTSKGSKKSNLEIIWGSFWGHLRIIWRSFWSHLGIILGSFGELEAPGPCGQMTVQKYRVFV